MLRLIILSFLLTFIQFSTCQHRRRENYQIEWNSSNTFFHTKSPPVLNVRLGDTIDFLCPHYNESSSSMEYNTIYLVSEIDYNLCFTKNYQPLIRCDQPSSSKRLIYTLSISKYLPYPTMPEFLDGYSYYFISTSNGQKQGLDQKFDGLCRTNNVRLILDVQKYYRRYSKSNIKIQKQLSKQTNIQWMTSKSRRLEFSSLFVGLLVVVFLR